MQMFPTIRTFIRNHVKIISYPVGICIFFINIFTVKLKFSRTPFHIVPQTRTFSFLFDIYSGCIFVVLICPVYASILFNIIFCFVSTATLFSIFFCLVFTAALFWFFGFILYITLFLYVINTLFHCIFKCNLNTVYKKFKTCLCKICLYIYLFINLRKKSSKNHVILLNIQSLYSSPLAKRI